MKRSSSDGTRGRVVAAVIVGILSIAPLGAQQPPQQREHVVKRGDTLWDIARAYLSNPFLWPLIYEANRNVVENPHLIYPAERLIIPPLPGEMQRTPEVAAQPEDRQGDTRFLVRADTGIDRSLLGGIQPVYYRVQPREFHAAPWLADSTTLDVRGWVFKSADPNTERDKLSTVFHPFDFLHLSYQGANRPRVGDLLLVVSLGRKVPGYGRVIEPTGVVRIDSLGPQTMLAMVTHQFGKLTTGDLVVPMDSFPSNLTSRPMPISGGAEGTIVEFLVPQPLYGTQEVGFVSMGSNAGIRVGDEISASLPPRQPERNRDEVLPAQMVARMLVMRVGSNSATVRVTHLEQPALRQGLPVRVIARMP